MTWVRLDDSMPEHPKMLALSDRAFRLHVAALCYCNRLLTDGEIPAVIASRLVSNGKRYAAELVTAGIWDEVAAGYQIHDYEDYQPSREAVLRDRAKTAERVANWRARKTPRNAVSNTVTPHDVTPLVTVPPVPDPDPDHPSIDLLSPSLQGGSASDLTIEIKDKTISPGVAASIERLTERLTDADHGTLGRLVKLAKAGAAQADFEDARAALREVTPTSPSRYACHIIQERLTSRGATA